MGRKRTFPPLKDGCAVEVGKEIGTTCWAQYKVPIVVYISVWFRTEKMNRVIMGTSWNHIFQPPIRLWKTTSRHGRDGKDTVVTEAISLAMSQSGLWGGIENVKPTRISLLVDNISHFTHECLPVVSSLSMPSENAFLKRVMAHCSPCVKLLSFFPGDEDKCWRRWFYIT